MKCCDLQFRVLCMGLQAKTGFRLCELIVDAVRLTSKDSPRMLELLSLLCLVLVFLSICQSHQSAILEKHPATQLLIFLEGLMCQ